MTECSILVSRFCCIAEQWKFEKCDVTHVASILSPKTLTEITGTQTSFFRKEAGNHIPFNLVHAYHKEPPSAACEGDTVSNI